MLPPTICSHFSFLSSHFSSLICTPPRLWAGLIPLGRRKGIVLSRTLAEQVAEIAGWDEADDWAGQEEMGRHGRGDGGRGRKRGV